MEPLSIRDLGDQGEREIARLLHASSVNLIRRPDFLVFFKNEWVAIEVKNKEPFQPPPSYMQGMPKTQYFNDLNMAHLGMPCILVVRGKDKEWLAQYIIKLKPQPDPRKHIKSNDEIIWFNLSQFIPIQDIFIKTL